MYKQKGNLLHATIDRYDQSIRLWALRLVTISHQIYRNADSYHILNPFSVVPLSKAKEGLVAPL